MERIQDTIKFKDLLSYQENDFSSLWASKYKMQLQEYPGDIYE